MRRRGALVVVVLAACGSPPTKDPVVAVNVTPIGVPSSAAVVLPVAPTSGANEPRIQIVAGARFCARVDGKVYCAPLDDLDQPIVQDKHAIAGIEDATQLVSGHGTMCVATRRGTVQCWGDNSFGQLGAHVRAERSETPVDVIGVADARRIFAGPWHFCAVVAEGEVRCWGRNETGQTGSDTTYLPEARELVDATVVPGVTADVLAGGFGFTCARTPGREVKCWGSMQDWSRASASGQRTERPTTVEGVADIEHLSAGETAACGVQTKGTVVCWGEGRRLVAGSGRAGRSEKVAPVEGIESAVRIATWDDHACALLADGRVSCFGFPYSGALGRATDANAGYEAVPGAIVEGVTRAVSISVSSGISCVLTRDDEVLCWGAWYSEKGEQKHPAAARVRLR